MKQNRTPVGARRHVVNIQQQSTTQDEYGGQVTTWNTVRSTWASLSTANAKTFTEAFQSGEFSGQVTHVINIRYTASPVITPGMRITFQTHVYQIQAVDNLNLDGIEVNLLCLEINGAQ